MIQGRTKKEFIEIENILSATTNGYDIFRFYLTKVGRIIPRPWGRKEKKMSWGIFPGSTWFYKDHATDEVGNAIQFVQKYFGLTLPEAIDKIAWDFGIGGQSNNANPVKITWEKPDVEKDFSEISVIDKPFTKKHHEFWNLMEVTEEHCRKMNCVAVKSASYNRSRIGIKPDEIVFGYYAPEERNFKLYFPERQEKRFKNTVTGHYLWNYENIKDCENLIVQKSNKDLIVTTLITPCVTATQNESAGIFDEEMVKKINKISKKPWIWYGSDDDGVAKCQKITGTNKWNYINTPSNLLPDVNDSASFVKMHNMQKMGTGLRALEDFMKSKNLII